MTPAGEIRARFRGHLGGFALDAGFSAPGRGVTALFGPSGCGKTSTLRCMAGLLKLEGECAIGAEIWQDESRFLPVYRRPIGYVFQEASLFAHMSVRRNLLYSTRGRQPQAGPGGIGFDEVVVLLGLAAMLDRAPANLSGGERQRVAIGRAILSQPRLLLMDEPLSALDRQTKEEIMPFLERLHETLSVPILLVTHDIGEVERLADHLILMRDGRVQASGSLQAMQSDPDLPLAGGRDAAVSLEATVAENDDAYGLAKLDVRGGRFLVPMSAARPPGTRLRIRVGAGDVSLAREEPGATTILNILPARIETTSRAGDHAIIVVLALGNDGSGEKLLARVTRLSWERLGLNEGMAVQAQIKSVALASRWQASA